MQTQFEVLVQSSLPELLKTQVFVPLITAFLSIFGENLSLEFEIVHHVFEIHKNWQRLFPLESNFELQ